MKLHWVLFYIFIFLLIGFPLYEYFEIETNNSFNFISAYISAWGTGATIIAIFLQRETIRLQSEEMKAQKKEFEMMNFNNSFFHLIDYFKVNKNNLKAKFLEDSNSNNDYEFIETKKGIAINYQYTTIECNGESFFEYILRDLYFFIETYKEILEKKQNIKDIESYNSDFKNKCIFSYYSTSFDELILDCSSHYENISSKAVHENDEYIINYCVKIIYKKHRVQLLSYLAAFDNIFQLVIDFESNKTTKLEISNFEKYYKIIESQFGVYEKTFLYFHIVSLKSKESNFDFIRKYSKLFLPVIDGYFVKNSSFHKFFEDFFSVSLKLI